MHSAGNVILLLAMKKYLLKCIKICSDHYQRVSKHNVHSSQIARSFHEFTIRLAMRNCLYMLLNFTTFQKYKGCVIFNVSMITLSNIDIWSPTDLRIYVFEKSIHYNVYHASVENKITRRKCRSICKIVVQLCTV